MKRFIVFFTLLIIFIGMYNASIIRNIFLGSLGDTLYRDLHFGAAQHRYSEIQTGISGGELLEADILYNLGNTLYRLGQKESGVRQIQYWKESVGAYTKSLAFRRDMQTEENLAFVTAQLQKEEKKQEMETRKEEQKKQEKEGASSGSGGSTEENTSTKTEEGSGTGDTPSEPESSGEPGTKQEEQKDPTSPDKKWSNSGSYNPTGGQNKDGTESTPLSETDREEVERYIEELKQFERYNGKLLNPETNGTTGGLSDQIRNFFGSDPFFQDMIPSNDGKKDW